MVPQVHGRRREPLVEAGLDELGLVAVVGDDVGGFDAGGFEAIDDFEEDLGGGDDEGAADGIEFDADDIGGGEEDAPGVGGRGGAGQFHHALLHDGADGGAVIDAIADTARVIDGDDAAGEGAGEAQFTGRRGAASGRDGDARAQQGGFQKLPSGFGHGASCGLNG